MAVKIRTVCVLCCMVWGSIFVLSAPAQTVPPVAQSEEKPAVDATKKDLTPPAPAIEIKRLEAADPLYSIELRDVPLVDLFRVMAHDYNLNMVVDSEVTGTVTASFTNVSLEEALQTIAEMSNLVVRKKGNIIRISLNLVTRTFTLKNIEAGKLLQGQRASSDKAVAAGATSLSNIYDLLSPQGKILVGNQPNSIMVIDYPINLEKVSAYLDAVDLRMSSRVFKLKYLKAGEVVGEQPEGAAK